MQQDRLERKRELDRKAQRAARARNKQHIEELEEAVRRLTAELEAERSRNGSSVVVARAAYAPAALHHDYLQWQGASPADMAMVPAGAPYDISVTPGFVTDALELHNHDAFHFEPAGSSNPFGAFMTPPAMTPQTSAILSAEMDFRHILDCDVDENLYPLINSAIIIAERIGKTQLLADELLDQDIVVRASVQDWDGVLQRYGTVDIGWRLIQAFEDLFWRECRPLERLVARALCRQVYVARARGPSSPETQPSSPLPDYLAPTATQQVKGSNSAIAHYFAWPSVRNVLTSTNLHYTRGFAQQFAKSFSFRWQYELRDVYMRNTETGVFTLSVQFQAAMSDISNFVMGRFDRARKGNAS